MIGDFDAEWMKDAEERAMRDELEVNDLDAIVAEAVAEYARRIEQEPARIKWPKTLREVIRAAVLADRRQRAAEMEALRAALRRAVWEPYLPDPTKLVCRDCRTFEGHVHTYTCELGHALTALAAAAPAPEGE